MEGFVYLAGGKMPIYATANRLYYRLGEGSAKPAQEIFGLARRLEPLLKDSILVPYVTIVRTLESLELWRTRRQSWNVAMSEGFLLAMLDERISCDVNPSIELSDEWLNGQKVIALCGASGMSQETATRLASWAGKGGALLATYDSGLYDAQGEVRRDGGALKEVLGAEMKGEPLEGQVDVYYRIKTAHPALAPYGEGAVVMGDARDCHPQLRGRGERSTWREVWKLTTPPAAGFPCNASWVRGALLGRRGSPAVSPLCTQGGIWHSPPGPEWRPNSLGAG